MDKVQKQDYSKSPFWGKILSPSLDLKDRLVNESVPQREHKILNCKYQFVNVKFL
jgi:hypothetical protein